MRFAVLLAILAAFIGTGGAICVLDNKRGWNVNCGIRDSYLLRLKDIGGIKANFDFGFGLGDEEGFAESIQNTHGGHHYARNDNEARGHLEEVPVPQQALRRSSIREAAPHFRKQQVRPPRRRSSASGEDLHVEHRSRGPPRGFRPAAPSFGLLPPPLLRRQTSEPVILSDDFLQRPSPGIHPQTPNDNVHTQQILVRPGTSPTIVFSHAPAPPPTPSPSDRPTVGPAIGDLLKVDASTPADTDHVPSFAAKMFIVREAPVDFHPPGYKAPVVFPKFNKRVEVPRTKFFCEEQKYLPGMYADVQLGCKVFHLCMPAAMGNTLTSFLCPNMTLFDQSIMQCNYWYHVNCEIAPSHYDANLPMALSYRKMNAAQLPLSAVRNFNNVALLSHNSEEMKNPRVVSPADPFITENLAFRRMGEVEDVVAEQRMDDEAVEVPRGPRKMSFVDEGEEESSEGEVESAPVKRSVSFSRNVNNMKTSNVSPLLFKLSRR